MKNLIHNFCDCATCEKNQEKAEKYLGMLKEAPDLVEFDKLKRTIERLKNFFNADNVLTKSEYKQKILGEEK